MAHARSSSYPHFLPVLTSKEANSIAPSWKQRQQNVAEERKELRCDSLNKAPKKAWGRDQLSRKTWLRFGSSGASQYHVTCSKAPESINTTGLTFSIQRQVRLG